jgi:hypothetical protein
MLRVSHMGIVDYAEALTTLLSIEEERQNSKHVQDFNQGEGKGREEGRRGERKERRREIEGRVRSEIFRF